MIICIFLTKQVLFVASQFEHSGQLGPRLPCCLIKAYCLSRGWPPGSPLRAPPVDSQIGPDAAQHHLQVASLPPQLDALLGHPACLSPQLAFHLPHPPHVLAGYSSAGRRTLLTQAGRRERDHGRPPGAAGKLGGMLNCNVSTPVVHFLTSYQAKNIITS